MPGLEMGERTAPARPRVAGRGGRPRVDQKPDAFAGLADHSRRRLLDELAGGDRTVRQLTLGAGISQPAVSQHLRVLLDAGLVEMRREGRCHRYRLRPEGLAGLRDWLLDLERFWRLRVDALRAHLDELE